MSDSALPPLEQFKVAITAALRARFNDDLVEEEARLQDHDAAWFELNASERLAAREFVDTQMRPHLSRGGVVKTLPDQYVPPTP